MAKTQSKSNHGMIELGKFILFLLLLPVIGAVTLSFQKEISELKVVYHQSFRWGVFSYAVLHFFVCDLASVYRFGQTVAADMFKWLSGLARVAPYIVPVYTVLTVLVYYLVVRVFNIGPNQGWWFFIIGFTFAMHIIMSARELYEADSALLKPNYLFDMTLVYILDIFLMVQLLNATAWKFSVAAFAHTVFELTRNFYSDIYFRFF